MGCVKAGKTNLRFIYGLGNSCARSTHGAFAAIRSNGRHHLIQARSSTMDDTIAAMMEVSSLITRRSDAARAEAQSIASGRERRTDDAYKSPTWVVLLPVSVAYTGGGLEQPVERLMTLQSAIAKAVHLATLVARFRPRFLPNRLVTSRDPGLSQSQWWRCRPS
jgi:hypothetical protein